MLECLTENKRPLKAVLWQEDLPVDIAFGYRHALVGCPHLILNSCYVNKPPSPFAPPQISEAVVLKLESTSESSGGIVTTQVAGSYSQSF